MICSPALAASSMASRSRRPRSLKLTWIVQDSRLLNLAPELRNLIYEFVAQNSTAISVRENKVLYCPPISLVCRQIRTEFKDVYLDDAPTYASRVNVHLTNFVTSSPNTGAVSSIHEVFPNDPLSGVERSWTVRVFMTNLWDRHRLDLRNFIEYGKILRTKSDLEIIWNPKTFDVEFLRETMQKLRFCHARTRPPPIVSGFDLIWPQVEKALVEAFERYAPPAKSTSTRGKRKRKSTEAETTPKKKQRRR